ncbi:T9SS type A sorting domain-containing protein [Aquimarina sp. TRL1]|uniref:T9SS type A sorting domain-containing protein n=1 Tax=Aquimarina sp. (strain TRL1) TaxID=2736252 RepID=UPI00158DF563|nr:T9SS type A sorting domain-containing protein [Aquimarina sp. TRL1]QKX05227.1 T9SS type A sorting domain-containing protein [Aquimarina sp. TRL1]
MKKTTFRNTPFLYCVLLHIFIWGSSFTDIDPTKTTTTTSYGCNLQVNAGSDIDLCEGDGYRITPVVTGQSTCRDCTEYRVRNTNDCKKGRGLVMVLSSRFGGEKVFTNDHLVWKETGNGRATLKGTIKEGGKTYDLDAEFWGKTTQYSHNPYGNVCTGGVHNVESWEFYTGFKGSVRERGWWFPMSFTFSRRGGPLQLGKGANTNDRDINKVGSSFWFSTSHFSYTVGDIHIMMDCVAGNNYTNTTYQWSNGATSPSIYVTNPGTYTVTVKDCDNCVATDSITISEGDASVDAGEDQTICAGETVTLTANGTGNFSWSTGATTASIQVSPDQTTTYSVTATDGNCQATDEVTVTVKNLTVDIGEDQSFCPGEEVTLTAQVNGASECNTISKVYKITDADTSGGCFPTPGNGVIFQRGAGCRGAHLIWKAGNDLILTEYEDNTATITGTVSRNGEVGIVNITLTNKTHGGNTWNAQCYKNGLGSARTFYRTFSGTITVNDTVYTVLTRGGNHYILADGASLDSNQFGMGAWTGGSFGECTEWFGDLMDITDTANTGGISYEWSTGETTQSITVTEAGNYSVTVKDCEGCEATDEVKITLTDVTAEAGADQAICLGETATLTAAGGGNYKWSTGETTQSIEVSPQETTTYSVTVTENGCTAIDEVIVTVNTASIDAGADQTICLGETVTLIATGTGDYLWSTGETTASIEVSPQETTTYTVTTSNDNCTATDEVIVIVNTVTVDAGADQSICKGENITLTATGSGDFLWSTGETTASIEVSPQETTTYTVTTTKNGCKATDEVTVTVHNPTVDIEVTPAESICLGESTTLIAIGSGDFLWSTGETTNSIEVSPQETTTYSVIAKEGTCEVIKEITITVHDVQVTAGDDETICLGESVTLTATGSGDFLWSTEETTASIEVSPQETTTYTVTTTKNGCKATDEVTVTVHNPTVDIEVTPAESICLGESTTLIAIGSGDFLWSTGETTNSIEVSPQETTTYSVTATEGNCEVIKEVTIIVHDVQVAAGDDEMICLGESVTLTATGSGDFLWSTGETTASIEVSPQETTTYTVTVNNNDCTAEDSVTVTVDELSVDAGEDQTICLGDEIVLTATAEADGDCEICDEYKLLDTDYCRGPHNFVVFINDNGIRRWFRNIDMTWKENADGTATVQGRVFEYNVSNTTFVVNATFSGLTATPPVDSPKGNDCHQEEDSSKWVYYTELTGTITQIGGDLSYTISRRGPAFQLGIDANNFEATPGTNGGSGWFSIEGDAESFGDFNFNLGDCVEPVINVRSAQQSNTDKVTYLWSTGEITRSIVVSPTETTTYRVTVDGCNDCTGADEITVYVEDCTIAIAAENTLKVYPTIIEASEHVFVELSSPQEETIDIMIYSFNGERIGKVVSNRISKGMNTIDIDSGDFPSLSSGIYFIKVQGDKWSATKKIGIK